MGKAIWEQEDRAGLMDIQPCFHMEPVLEDTPIILCSAASIIVILSRSGGETGHR